MFNLSKNKHYTQQTRVETLIWQRTRATAYQTAKKFQKNKLEHKKNLEIFFCEIYLFFLVILRAAASTIKY